MVEFQPESLLAALNRRGVRYVVIGGFAATIHGSPYVTGDVDITPEHTPSNLVKLSEALNDLEARIWTSIEPPGLTFDHDAESIGRVSTWNLVTRHGRLDIAFQPSGTGGYPDLIRSADRLTILGVEVEVSSLADVVRSKEAADRAKDRIVLPVLRRILEESID